MRSFLMVFGRPSFCMLVTLVCVAAVGAVERGYGRVLADNDLDAVRGMDIAGGTTTSGGACEANSLGKDADGNPQVSAIGGCTAFNNNKQCVSCPNDTYPGLGSGTGKVTNGQKGNCTSAKLVGTCVAGPTPTCNNPKATDAFCKGQYQGLISQEPIINP